MVYWFLNQGNFMTCKSLNQINELNDAIANAGDVWELYYKRGYYYFLEDNSDLAKDDYKHAMALGLDPTEYPYYSFKSSNSMRRELLLPEKLMVSIILVMLIVAIAFQIMNFFLKV